MRDNQNSDQNIVVEITEDASNDTVGRHHVNLSNARKRRNDEFYTRFEDVESEVMRYREQFRGKVVYCNCDDPDESAFAEFFRLNFMEFGMKGLITTCYKSTERTLFSRHNSDQGVVTFLTENDNSNHDLLNGDGDFRSSECIELLKQADIVVTNPPFSLFRDYVAQLIEYEKKFLIIGNKNAITYSGVFPHIQSGNMWIGYTPMGYRMWFNMSDEHIATIPQEELERDIYEEQDGRIVKRIGTCWFTNLDHARRHEDLLGTLALSFDPMRYSTYDNYDAIEVEENKFIPRDYHGVMGVPITYINIHNPDQFEIVGASESEGTGFSNGLWNPESRIKQPMVNGERKFKRLFIRQRRIARQDNNL